MVEACLYPVNVGTAAHCRGFITNWDKTDAKAGNDTFAGERVSFFPSGSWGEFEICDKSFSAFIP